MSKLFIDIETTSAGLDGEFVLAACRVDDGEIILIDGSSTEIKESVKNLLIEHAPDVQVIPGYDYGWIKKLLNNG